MQKCYSNHAYIHGYCSFAFNILVIFFVSFTSLSLFLSSASRSHLPLFLSLVPHCHSLISKASRHWWTRKQATTNLQGSKPCHWSPKQAHSRRATADRHRSSLAEARRQSSHHATIDRRWSFVWSVIVGVLIIFNFLFDQFWIFCLISGFWGFDLFNSLFDQWVLGWWWLMIVLVDGGWCWCLMTVGWWW